MSARPPAVSAHDTPSAKDRDQTPLFKPEAHGASCYIDNCPDPVVDRFPVDGGPWWCARHLEEQLS